MPIVPALIVVYALTLGQCADIPREVFEPLNDIAQGCVRDEESRGATFRALRKWCATQDPPIKLTHDERRCLHAHADSLRRLAKRRALLGLNCENEGNDVGGEMSYVVVRDETNDVGAIKAEVINSIAVSGAVNEQNLRRVMLAFFKSIRERVGYKYYTHPTNVYIDVYTSEEHAKAEGGTWIAQLSWIEDEGRKPELTFRKERFRRSAPLKPRFGLSIEEQKEVYKGIILLQIQADIDAERKIPAWRDGAGWSKLKSKLTKRYANALAKRYGLSRKQLEAIALEGGTYGWPMPTDIPWFDTPVLDPNLKPGKKYRLSKDTPVMPHYAPADPLQAIVDMKILAPGATIIINERRMKDGDHPWYKVTAVNPGAPRKIRGWINYLAFVGQNVHEVP